MVPVEVVISGHIQDVDGGWGVGNRICLCFHQISSYFQEEEIIITWKTRVFLEVVLDL